MRRQRRRPVRETRAQVQLVGEFVDDDVEAAFGELRVLPGQNQRPAFPGLTGGIFDVLVHHAVFVLARPGNAETGRVHDDFVPAFVQFGGEVQDGQAGLGRNGQAHEVRHFQPLRAVDVLAGQQPGRTRQQLGGFIGVQYRQERVGVQHLPPQFRRDAGLHFGHCGRAGAAALQPAQHKLGFLPYAAGSGAFWCL
ncbi:hypothetical protein FQZ97_756560 [compost metagenome]